MDLIVFWNDIEFVPLYREKGLWVMGATVNSGQHVQLRVVSKNKAMWLRDMNWIFIYGIRPQEKERIQYFSAHTNIEKVLELHNEDLTSRLYVHRWEPYTIKVDLDPNIINMTVPDDKCTLVEIISKPGFTIKKQKAINTY